MSFEMTTSVATTNQILTLDVIQAEISSKISRVHLLLQVNSSYSITLLLKFKWDIDALKESFHASHDLSDLLISNKVCLKTLPTAPIHQECQVCFALESVKGLACCHMACARWNSFLKNKISSGNPSIECFDCSLLICNDQLGILLGNTELLIAYQKLVVNSYVDSVSNLTWCKKKCGNAVRNTGTNEVTCSCGVKFCFQCKRDPHTPASCDQMKLWKRACEEHKELGKFADKKSWKWVRDNTRECPNCWAPIQKNGGCKHIHCQNCKHNFCWICRGNWIYHRSPCKPFKMGVDGFNQQKIAPYLIPFNYQKQKLDNTVDSSSLSECRRVLMYSYVYSYYQGPGKITKDFKQLQKKLRDELDLEKSRQNLEKCEGLRKSILDSCYSHPRGEEVGKRKRNGCCNFIFVVFLLLLFCFILAGIIAATVLFFK